MIANIPVFGGYCSGENNPEMALITISPKSHAIGIAHWNITIMSDIVFEP